MIEEEMDNTMEMDANPDYADNLGDLEGDLQMCYQVVTVVEEGEEAVEEVEPEIISFDSVFKSNVRAIIDDLKNSLSKDDGLFETSFFDPILI